MNPRALRLLSVIAGTSLSLFLVVPQMTLASDDGCEQDPVYDRDMSGVTIMGARVRVRPCMTNSDVLTTVEGNSNVNIIGETDGWYKVKIGDTIGWMGSRLVRQGEGGKVVTTPIEKKPVAEEIKKEKKPPVEEMNWKKWIVGITNADLFKLQNGDSTLLKRLKGKIVIQVQEHGEAYYVHSTGKILSLKDLVAVIQAMTGTSEQIKKMDKETAQKETPKEIPNGSIVLKAARNGTDAKLTWTVSNVDVDVAMGFKVVVSQKLNPIYPGNDYHYLSDKSVQSDVWSKLTAGKTYYFRVCQYLGGKCGVYSNNASVSVPNEVAPVSNQNGSISLSAVAGQDKHVDLSWSLKDMTSSMGFKVVVADHENPIYPGDTYHYLSSPDQRTDYWTDLGSGTKYFRVCEYLGGKCGIYSNNVTVTLP